jgi:alpha-galactosidase
LEEFNVKSGLWPFTKHGRLGDADDTIIQINGYKSPKGLSMHPPEQDYAAASYRLGKQASLFRAEVALNDSSSPALSAAVFEVWGDGKRLWKSKPINQLIYSQRCRVDVSKVDVLELRVSSTGSPVDLHAVWYEPRLLEKANTLDK